MIGIIVAMQSEAKHLKSNIDNPIIKKISNVEFTVGKIYGREVCIAISGIGKVLAAITTEAMIINFRPDFIISTGVAGGLDKDLKIGDVAVAKNLVQHDMDTTSLGDAKGLISGVNKVYFETDKDITNIIIEATKKNNIQYKLGTIASGDTFINGSKGDVIKREFNAISCEMESASVSLVCYQNDVKFACFRAISDNSDDNSNKDYDKNLTKACEISSIILKEILKIA